MNILLDLGSATLQQFNCFELYKKKFKFSDYDKIICFEPLIQLINFCKIAYRNKSNIEYINKAVSDYSGKTIFKFQQNQLEGRSFNTINIRNKVVGSAGIIQCNNMTPKYLSGRIQQREVEVISIQNVLSLYDINNKNYNVLKMDIQGSEYPIIKWLIENDKLKLFKEIYVQFHLKLFNNDKRLKELENKFHNQCNKFNIIVGQQNANI